MRRQNMDNQITFTDNAIQQVEQILHSNMVADDVTAIRVFVAGGGCSGFQYGFAPCNEQDVDSDDYVFDFASAKFVVDPLSMMYLEGSTVDFAHDVMAQQFTISNPNAKSQCGCGHSFTA